MENPEKLKIIGHRGAAGLAFENSLAAFQTALDLGVSIIELDVWQTTDDQIVVFHDAYLDRLTNAKGFIADADFAFLQKTPLKNGDPIPTLQEVISLVKTKPVTLLVEVKHEKAFNETLRLVQSELPFSRFIIGSFYHEGIGQLKKDNPGLQTAIMFEGVPAGIAGYLEKVDPDLVVVSIETFNASLVNTVKAQHRKLVFYTVNSEPEIALALQAKPYGIVTNFPDRFLR